MVENLLHFETLEEAVSVTRILQGLWMCSVVRVSSREQHLAAW